MRGEGEVLDASHMWFSDKINMEEFAAHMMGATYPNFTNYIKHKKYWSFSDPDDFSGYDETHSNLKKYYEIYQSNKDWVIVFISSINNRL